MKPKVTVGVCVRNCAAMLPDAVESIMAQDYPHELMEVIFVDDGSEDETLALIRGYAQKMDMEVKIFHHEWKGLGASRNVVVNNASGKYIVWIDGDMIIPKDHIKKQVEFMEKNPKIGIAKAKLGVHPKMGLIALLENAAYIASHHRYGGKATSRALGTGGAIYRVNAIKHVGGFDVVIAGVGEDIDAEHRIRKAGWITYLGAPTTFYEQRTSSWKDLWKKNFWYGQYGYYLMNKTNGFLNLLEMTPMVGFIVGAWYSTIAYKLIHRKTVFLMPFEYFLKRVAWCFGFFDGWSHCRKLLMRTPQYMK